MLQVSLAVLGFLAFLLIFTIPATPGALNRAPAYMAHATPGVVARLGAYLIGSAIALQLAAVPLKRRWDGALKGWIN